jgi:hypothetical protein
MLVDEHGHVRACWGEPDRLWLGEEALVLGSRRLLEAIQRLGVDVDMLGVLSVDEAIRLKIVDTLSQPAMQERVLDIKLVRRPTLGGRQVEHGANSAQFNDRREGLVEIDPLALLEAHHDPTHFAAF